MGGIARSKRSHLLSIGGTDNHVHLALKLKPVDALSKTIGEPKGNSSKWVNDKDLLCGYFTWQAGFGAFYHPTSDTKHVETLIGPTSRFVQLEFAAGDRRVDNLIQASETDAATLELADPFNQIFQRSTQLSQLPFLLQ